MRNYTDEYNRRKAKRRRIFLEGDKELIDALSPLERNALMRELRNTMNTYLFAFKKAKELCLREKK